VVFGCGHLALSVGTYIYWHGPASGESHVKRKVCRLSRFSLLLLLVLAAACRAPALSTPPLAPREAFVEVLHGMPVSDPYRWMEANDARFEAWLRSQDDHARRVLGGLPGRADLGERVAHWSRAGEALSRVRLAGGLVFVQKRAADEEHDRLVVRALASGTERTLFAPPDGQALDFFLPAPDGAHVLIGTSLAGSQDSVIGVLRVADGSWLDERIPRAEEARPSWRDAASFFYTQLAEVSAGASEVERYRRSRVRLHVLGTDAHADPVVLGPELEGLRLEPDDVAFLRTVPGARHALALVARGDQPDWALHVAELTQLDTGAARWTRVADFADGVADALVAGPTLYLLSRAGAPRFQVLALDLATPELARARVVVPESERVLVALAADSEALYVSTLSDGLGGLQRMPHAGGSLEELALPLSGSLRRPVTDPDAPGVLIGLQDWITPQSWFLWRSGAIEPLALAGPSPLDTRAFVVEESRVITDDGAQIPLSIVRRADLALEGRAPAWLVAYGAYGIPLLSDFLGGALAFVEAGGVYAVAHVRGGGEGGADWHAAGKGVNKPRAALDLVACAEALFARGLASPDTLAIAGTSGGGVTVGLALTRRPELFRAALLEVADCNPLRLEVTPDGPFMAEEWGTTESEAGFRALLAMDPTQAIEPGRPYPAVLFTAGFRDPRVPPWQPAKLAAHLQAAGSARGPVLLRVDFEGGHLAGLSSSTRRSEELTDQLAFLLAHTRGAK